MVRNCRWFSRSDARATPAAMGAYNVSHTGSLIDFSIRAGAVSPGSGIVTVSCARNTTVPNTRRIGWAKLPAVY